MKNKKNLLVILLLVALVVLAIPGVSEATGEMLSEKDSVKDFISLNTNSVFFLFILGFLAGVLSGFIGSGGAFVLTPGMMALGVPAAVAVATNMCHKFPKALVGAYKRFKYGQVDIKLGLINGISACVGVQIGIQIQKIIMEKWGAAGSNLYVSLVFVSVLTVLGIYVLSDARKSMRSGEGNSVSSLAERIKKINIPPMIYFKTANVRISFWVTVPVGLATGLLAATIAVGGFVGVPGMVYVMGVPAIVASASELIIAFTMGLSGSFTWALSGFIDIRMVVIIMAGSLIGVQIGAVGTTYVKDYMIKYVMSSVMLIVAVSRSFAIPPYLQDLGFMHMTESTVNLLKNVSFVLLCLALAAGGLIILGSMFKKRREIKAAEQAQVMQHS
ncbi:membrane protein, putative [Desulfocucumis palustris]|uniref:Probable membrane transporter protein n=1 Tax=Desulfocucumis palustris TaxID=1898651 RepID=A0A2L2XB64_9FIRM|nr:sulfite exporter TauE/SafE family protein [Desulfocucumis palustris]GBF33537.1 membrane protein, putative [Desulfocucumis palustris]